MNVAIVFDSSFPAEPAYYDEVMAPSFKSEPDPEYQIAHALRQRGHTVKLLGAHDDPMEVMHRLRESPVDIVWNASEGFGTIDSLDFLLPALLDAEGVPLAGSIGRRGVPLVLGGSAM